MFVGASERKKASSVPLIIEQTATAQSIKRRPNKPASAVRFFFMGEATDVVLAGDVAAELV